jgi:hypothetical protein
MSRRRRIHGLFRLVPWPTLLLLSACGGDKGPSGPDGGDAQSYELVALGQMELPADAQLEDCTTTRFYSGRLEMTDDWSWRIRLQVHDGNGEWPYLDEGEMDEAGASLMFISDYSGAVYEGRVNGSEVRIMYDWCFNGMPDVQLVFDR